MGGAEKNCLVTSSDAVFIYHIQKECYAVLTDLPCSIPGSSMFAAGRSSFIQRTGAKNQGRTLVLAIAGAIEEELTRRGLQRTDSNPDLYIQMYGSVDSDMGVSYSDPLYIGKGGIPPFDQSFLMWGAVPGSTTTVVVHKGQLVVDLIDATEKKLAWRGMATEKLSDKKEKLIKQINTAVERMFQQYPAGKK